MVSWIDNAATEGTDQGRAAAPCSGPTLAPGRRAHYHRRAMQLAPSNVGRLKASLSAPAPHITIKANGEVATCRLANAGEGYGNIHDRPFVDILNRMQESFVFRLHAERLLGQYLPMSSVAPSRAATHIPAPFGPSPPWSRGASRAKASAPTTGPVSSGSTKQSPSNSGRAELLVQLRPRRIPERRDVRRGLRF